MFCLSALFLLIYSLRHSGESYPNTTIGLIAAVCVAFLTLNHLIFVWSKKCLSGGTKPVLYLSANMRSVMLPADTQAGSVIYRLRASDADDQYPISFGVVGKSPFSVRYYPMFPVTFN